jgi:hypothetical protein
MPALFGVTTTCCLGCRSYLAANHMDNTRDQFLEGVCVGVFLAVWNEVPGICAPQGSILNQAIKVTLQYLDNRPARPNFLLSNR